MLKIWNVAAKVSKLDAEVAFVQSLGGTLVLDEIIPFEGQEIRLVLMRWADKYLHLFEKAVYEHRLASPLSNGLCHVVFELDELDDLDEWQRRALAAGAQEIMPRSFVRAQFGTRDVAFLRSPGGMLFELVMMHENKVPVLP